MRTLTNLALLVAVLASFSTPGDAQAQPFDMEEELVALFEAEDGYFAGRSATLRDADFSEVALEALSSHPDWRVRTQAAILQGWQGNSALFSAVYDASPVPSRRDRKVRFLDEVFANAAAAPAILERLLHGGERDVVRAGLAHALVGLHPHWAEDMVGILGATESPSLAVAAVAALQWAEPEGALAGLRLAFNHPSSEVRAAAASVAGWRADGVELAMELRAILSDPEVGPRSMAARSLGWLGDVEAVDGLVPLLDDSAAEVRLHALRALGRVAPERAAQEVRGVRFASERDERVLRVLTRIRSR